MRGGVVDFETNDQVGIHFEPEALSNRTHRIPSIFGVRTEGLPFHERDLAVSQRNVMLQTGTNALLLIQDDVRHALEGTMSGHTHGG